MRQIKRERRERQIRKIIRKRERNRIHTKVTSLQSDSDALFIKLNHRNI